MYMKEEKKLQAWKTIIESQLEFLEQSQENKDIYFMGCQNLKVGLFQHILIII